jgi:pycsar effector protein
MNATRKDQARLESVIPYSADAASGEAVAWKLHAMLQDWIAKVDTKASIVMTLETALLSGLIVFSGSNIANYPLVWKLLQHCGLVLLFASILIAGAVVFPRLRRRDSAKSWQRGFIYFGHLRNWEPEALAEALKRMESSSSLRMLSDQLVTMSRIAWNKQILVQCSLLVALTGCVAAGIPLVALA